VRIENVRLEQTNEYARVVATITWEDCNRPQGEVYFATLPRYRDSLSVRTDAFLTAFALLAAWYGEARLKIEGSLCPVLLEGLVTNLATIRFFENWSRPKLKIEARIDRRQMPRPKERTAAFLSRGVDSLFTLRRNWELVPRNHPFHIRDVIHVQGAGFPEDPAFQLNRTSLERLLAKFAGILEGTQVNLIPVLSNLRDVAGVHTKHFARFWDVHFHKAAIASVAHTMGRRITKVMISSGPPNWRKPPGALSNLPYNYSSQNLRIIYYGSGFTRLEKLRYLTSSKKDLDNILVCTKYSERNCGRCLKCMWTKVALLALGEVDSCKAFMNLAVCPDDLRRVAIITPSDFELDYDDLIKPLREDSRGDLVIAIQEMLEWAGSWNQWRDRAIDHLITHVPSGAAVILVDDAALEVTSLVGNRKVIPFLEKNGEYYGSPASDDAAIHELERLRAAGAEFLAIAWPSAWWLDVYRGWAADVRARFACVLDNPGVMIFDLRAPAKRNEAA
jgi:hypothetical protein